MKNMVSLYYCGVKKLTINYDNDDPSSVNECPLSGSFKAELSLREGRFLKEFCILIHQDHDVRFRAESPTRLIIYDENYPETFVEGFHDEESVRKMEYRDFGDTGMKVSVLSMGCAGIAPGTYRITNEEESIKTVQTAIRNGINFLDVAPWYGFGTCEVVLGKALEGIPRKAYYIATKVGRYKPQILQMFDFSAERTFQSVEESLEKLQVEYIDVIQVHDVEFSSSLDIVVKETLPALKKLQDVGKVKFIGITGLPPTTLHDLYKRSTIKIDSVLCHCHHSLVNTEFNKYVDEYKENGTASINAAVLCMGLLTELGPMDWHPAHPEIKQACRDAIAYCQERDVDISRIATYYSLETFKGATSLIGFAEINLLRKILDILYNKINEREKGVLKEIIEKFMQPLTVNNWEDIELQTYWSKYKTALKESTLL
ncbi:L-galactose dehydrogenase [Nymphon striatum]|nr:L-galactose dehydrogenase [Nymphon striatum]